jgi:hypothetical protein
MQKWIRRFRIRKASAARQALEERNGSEQQEDQEQDGDDQQGDLCCTIRPAAEDFAGAGVDQDTVRLITVAIIPQPNRQEKVLECYPHVLGADSFQALVIAADVPLAQLANVLVHDGSRRGKALFEADGVALRLESAEEFRFELFQFLQIPRQQLGPFLVCEAL